MKLHVYRHVVYVGGEYRFIESQEIDISEYEIFANKGTRAKYILVEVSSVGEINVVDGTEVDFADLDFPDIPDTTSGAMRLAAVRVWSGQTGAVEARTQVDIIDLRFSELSSGATRILTSDVEISTLNITPNKTIQDYLNTVQSSGYYAGGDFTDNGDGTATVAAGVGAIRATNALGAQIEAFQFAETVVALVDGFTNYIYVKYNLGNPIVVPSTTKPTDNRTNVLLGKIYKEGSELHLFKAGMYIPEIAGNSLMRFIAQFGEVTRTAGGEISETGILNIAVDDVLIWGGFSKRLVTGYDTSVSGSFENYYYNGADWPKTNETQINNTKYNDIVSGTLENIANNKIGVHWVYVDADGHMMVVYGQDSYSFAEADAAQPPSSLPNHITEFAFLAAKIIIEEGATTFIEIQSAYAIAFTSSVAGVHNDLAGLNVGDFKHLTSVEYVDMTGGVDSVLHHHDTDRARANHTGTQAAATILDFDDNVTSNSAVVLNTAKNSYPSADASKLAGIEAGAEVNNISDADAADLTGSGETILHSHNAQISGDEATLQERMFAGRTFDDGFDYDTLPAAYSFAGTPFYALPSGTGTDTYDLVTKPSLFYYDIRSGKKFFLYKSGTPSGSMIFAGGFAAAVTDSFTGLRLDNGTDNNYVEVGLVQQSTGNWSWQIRYRVSGGTVVKVTATDSVNVPFVFNILMNITGTKWTSWSVNEWISIPFSAPSTLQMMKATAGVNFTWTPTRHGLVGYAGGTAHNLGLIDHWGANA